LGQHGMTEYARFRAACGAMSDEERLRDSIIVATVTTVNLLARGEYGVLESMTEGRSLSAEVLE
jgi:hypothetical protein